MAAIGASFGGVRALTATAGPGLSLMQENIGLAAMAEIPVVIVDTQRGGPSTGMPTKVEQSDLFALVHGTHGDAPRLVLAPGSPRQMFSDVQLAFNLADNYHCPVLIASDLAISEWQQTVSPADLSFLPIDRGPIADPDALVQLEGEFARYDTSVAVSPRSFPGIPGGQYLATGAEHGPSGKVTEDPSNRRQMMERRLGRLQTLAIGGQPVSGLEVTGHTAPDVLLIALGYVTGAVSEAAGLLDEAGLRAQVAQVRLLAPLPVSELRWLMQGAGRTFVIEQNAQGQLAALMRGAGVSEEATSLLKFDGTLFTAAEIVERLQAALSQGE
jgi:2-oxoglutarate ferredoxin oxidoreductase subunit alpha